MRYMAMFLVLALFLAGCQTTTEGAGESIEDSDETVSAEMPAPDSEGVEEMVAAGGDKAIEGSEYSGREAGEGTDAAVEETTKTFVLTGENFKFLMDGQEAPELKVKVGDKVRIEFSATSGFHDWKVDEFNAATEQVKPEAGMTSVEFVADKAGTFEYYCSVGQHRANGMFGNLVVEE